MKLYLSSHNIGSNPQPLIDMLPLQAKACIISNAKDYKEIDNESLMAKSADLVKLGIECQLLDLKTFFGKKDLLANELEKYDLIWVCGGNCFVLLQAMKLSGFDKIIQSWYMSNKDIVYGGYSAGICVIGPTLKGIHLMDDIEQKPYGSKHEVIRDGLGILPYTIVPHYKSNHHESLAADKAVEYMIDNKILFKTLKDGEVITQ